MKIWLIDDDNLTNMLNQMLIEQFDSSIEIVCFEYAEVAAERLNDKVNWPDVIFLDINMPVMNAWDFLEKSREIFDSFQEQPVIHILTSSSNPQDRAMADNYKELSEYLIKPLNESTISKVLTLKNKY